MTFETRASVGRHPSGAPVGTIASKYRIFATLGRGGMADVFLAVVHGPGGFTKLVVLKTLRETRGDDPSFVTMFLDEARLSARLNHPNVVHTYEVGEHGDAYFIAMEYLEGQPLHRVAQALAHRGERMAPAMAAHVLAEALRGLDHAHGMTDYDGSRLGIVHRDVSPQNIHVAYDGQVRVLDFGIAKAALNTSHTQAGVLKGKFAYMSPEQTTGDNVDCRSDIFAAGVVLWELLAGERLFKGDNAAALGQLVKAHIDPPSSRCAGVPAQLDAIVMRAVRRDPDERYATAQEMALALESFLHATGERATREDVARCLSDLFGDAREEAQRNIQAHMAALPRPSSPSLPMLQTGGHPALTTSSSGIVEVLSSVDVFVPTPLPPSPPPRRSRATLLRYGGAVAAAGGAAVLALTLLARKAPAAATSSQAPPAQRPSTAPSMPEVESFHLTLTSDPLEAHVEWAGKSVGQTPMLIDLLAGPQTFVLSREGYFSTSVIVNVTPSMDGHTQSRTVVLVPRPSGTSTTSAHPGNVEGKTRRAVTSAKPSPAAAPPDPPTAAIVAEPSVPAPPALDVPVAPASPTVETPRAAANPGPAVLPFGPDMSRPVLLSGSDPIYTREAVVARVEGVMIARCTITVAGRLENCRILKGLPYMDVSMLDALATRRYSPAIYQGKPIAVEYVFNVKLAAPR